MNQQSDDNAAAGFGDRFIAADHRQLARRRKTELEGGERLRLNIGRRV